MDWIVAMAAGAFLMAVGWGGSEPSAPGALCFTLGGSIVLIGLRIACAHLGWWPL